jgi:hypothetical protein
MLFAKHKGMAFLNNFQTTIITNFESILKIRMNFLLRCIRFLLHTFLVFTDFLFVFLLWFIITVTMPYPKVEKVEAQDWQRISKGNDFYSLHNNWLKKSNSGLWEMYVVGNGYERGIVEGKLTKELAEQQEIAFVNQIKVLIPSQAMLNYLKFFIGFFNRHLNEYIVDEYKQEIYGESQYASDKFDFIAPKYYRLLNYHAAHDIGHALQDKNMTVGCTAFSAWGNKTDDGSLLVARNFDFYVGDEFAENKLMYFVKPKTGYKLMMISWAGMIGTVSGMNEKGLTVTLNASKSEIPTSAATPISIVAREILQYAATIDEAFAIAKKRKTFVSESIFIGSKADNSTATIEKTPSKTELFRAPNSNYIICANHYQGSAFAKDAVNLDNIHSSSSNYRFNHLTQLINEYPKISVADAAAIMRNRGGMNEQNIGMGNEKSLNQLIAHHSVLFKPAKLQMWVSTNPFQLGKYICYDLNNVFAEAKNINSQKEIYESNLTIPADSFLYSQDFKKFKAYKKMKAAMQFAHRNKLAYQLDNKTILYFVKCNPEYFETYFIIGNYFAQKNNKQEALKYYNLALSKEITTRQDKEAILNSIKNLNN